MKSARVRQMRARSHYSNHRSIHSPALTNGARPPAIAAYSYSYRFVEGLPPHEKNPALGRAFRLERCSAPHTVYAISKSKPLREFARRRAAWNP